MNNIIIPISNLLEEDSVAKLQTNTTSNFDSNRGGNSGRVQIISKTFIPYPNDGLVEVKAKSRSSAKVYDTQMMFSSVEYGEGGETQFQSSDGQAYRIVPIGYGSGDVKVNCGCLDFYYRFAAWNHSNGSLHGNPPKPYIKKTDSEPLNPKQIPGLCKHLMALAGELRRDRFLR